MFDGKDDEFSDLDDDESEDDVIVLEDEEGKESRFKILLDSLFVDDKQYVVLMPVEEEDALEPEIVILRVDEGLDGKGVLVTIDSDDEWEEVLKAFEEMDVEGTLGDFEIEVEDDRNREG